MRTPDVDVAICAEGAQPRERCVTLVLLSATTRFIDPGTVLRHAEPIDGIDGNFASPSTPERTRPRFRSGSFVFLEERIKQS